MVHRMLIAVVFAALGSSGPALSNPPTAEDGACIRLADLASPAERQAWRLVNDGVMGGRSTGAAEIPDASLRFFGVINTDGGGFASVRRDIALGALGGRDRLTLRVRSDGRAYRLTARTDARFRNRLVSYQAPLPQTQPGEWTNVSVPFSAFTPSVFGRAVPATAFQADRAGEIGVIIADGRDGPFALEVAWVDVCR